MALSTALEWATLEFKSLYTDFLPPILGMSVFYAGLLASAIITLGCSLGFFKAAKILQSWRIVMYIVAILVGIYIQYYIAKRYDLLVALFPV